MALYCTLMRCDSPRCARGAGLRKPSQQRTRENAYTRTCARTPSPRSSLLLEQACSPSPARSADWLDGPCLASCSMYLGSNSSILDPKGSAAFSFIFLKGVLWGASVSIADLEPAHSFLRPPKAPPHRRHRQKERKTPRRALVRPPKLMPRLRGVLALGEGQSSSAPQLLIPGGSCE